LIGFITNGNILKKLKLERLLAFHAINIGSQHHVKQPVVQSILDALFFM